MERYVAAGDIVCNVTDMETIYNRERKKILDAFKRHEFDSRECSKRLKDLAELWKQFKRRKKK